MIRRLNQRKLKEVPLVFLIEKLEELALILKIAIKKQLQCHYARESWH